MIDAMCLLYLMAQMPVLEMLLICQFHVVHSSGMVLGSGVALVIVIGGFGSFLIHTPYAELRSHLAFEGFLYTHAYANVPVCAPARNTIITGVYACSNGSQHMLGRAADIKINGIDPQVVAEAAGHFGATGIKSYRTFTHIDTRSGAPWLREA